MDEGVIRGARAVATWMERVLALAILVAVVVFAYHSVGAVTALDWSQEDALYEVIYRVLLLVIGVELARTLITHDLMAILELLAFVIARKMLKPDLPALDILVSAVGFIGLLAARRFLIRPDGPAGGAGTGREKE